MAAQPDLLPRFVHNPVVFAAWYAPIAAALEWPADVVAIQTAQRGKKMNLERMSSLLKQVNYATDSSSRDVEYMRSILEGLAVHDWVAAEPQAFLELVNAALRKFSKHYDFILDKAKNNFSHRVQELVDCLELTDLERDLLVFGVASAVSDELRTILSRLDQSNRLAPEVFAGIFGVSVAELAGALAETSPLRLSGLLRTRGTLNRYPVVSEFWIRVLAESPEGLARTLTEPIVFRPTSGVPARLPSDDLDLAAALVANASEPGVNLMLYGAGGLDKQGVLRELVERTNRNAHRLAKLESSYGEEPTIAYIAQRCLPTVDKAALLVLDRPDAILEAQPSGYMAKMFGLEVDPGQVAPFDELILTSNPLPTVWLSANVSSLSPDTVSRFVFHAGLQKARREDRRAQLERTVKGLDLSRETEEALLRLEDVSGVQLEAGMRAARLFGVQTPSEYEAALLQAVKRSLKALERGTSPKAKECVTQYSLDFLNCAGRFGPKQILTALTRTPKGSICLYGIPGTGKTQYVEYLAQTLGKRLLAKRGSDIMSKWVGETEKNIAAMFEEAESEDAILFLDEGDSLLGDRNKAHASHDVSKVNELLAAMERFTGIFVLGTNLFEGLDTAALRRFTFKLQFLALTAEQRWEMFLNEASLRETQEGISEADKARWSEELIFMPNLCAGDFATVKRQCVLLGESLSPDEWIGQLQLECQVKSRAQAQPGAPRTTVV
ncbi:MULTISPECIES: ATP-binding protein [unclassified Variovorax]|uniref:ATP-binding protein n=1 Tax=unclassified Variovorax TaxID=663243 RepID=UPI0013A567A0|nr:MULTISPECIES: AAA family ATPase [unclassified Variovorax]